MLQRPFVLVFTYSYDDNDDDDDDDDEKLQTLLDPEQLSPLGAIAATSVELYCFDKRLLQRAGIEDCAEIMHALKLVTSTLSNYFLLKSGIFRPVLLIWHFFPIRSSSDFI